jgi:hypothetical protein
MTSIVRTRKMLDTLDETTAVAFLLVGPAIGAAIVLVWFGGLALTLLSSLLH